MSDDEAKRVSEYQRLMESVASGIAQRVWQILQNRDDVLDVLQDVQLKLWQKWEDVRIHPDPSALAIKVGVERALDVRRAHRRNARRNTIDLTSSRDASLSAEQLTELSEAHQHVLDAIARLPDQQSVCVYLRLVEQQEYAQIAATLQIAEATVRKHVERGRRQLQQWLAYLITSHEVKP